MVTKPQQRLTGERGQIAEGGMITNELLIFVIAEFARQMLLRAEDVLSDERSENRGFALIDRANELILGIIGLGKSEREVVVSLDVGTRLQAGSFQIMRKVAPLYPHRVNLDNLPF